MQTTGISSDHDQTPVKFQKNQYKTVGGVAPTRYPLSIHIVIDNSQKWLSSAC